MAENCRVLQHAVPLRNQDQAISEERKNAQPKVTISVIVPIYRVEKYLPACIESLLKQTVADFELILVDDGSPDNCGTICDEAAKHDARIRVIHQTNQGLSAARNAGIEAAHGEWLSFIDSDDFIAPNFLEFLLRAAERTGADCAMCVMQLTDAAGNAIEGLSEVATGVCTGHSIQELVRSIVNPNYFIACNKLYRRAVFETLRYPVGRQNEDVFVFVELFDKAKTVVVLPDKLYFYRQSEGSIMRSGVTTLRNLDEMWAYHNCFEYFAAHGQEALMPYMEKRMFAKLTGVYYRLPKDARRSKEMKAAKKALWDADWLLIKRGALGARALLRTLLFCALPGVYGLRMKH